MTLKAERRELQHRLAESIAPAEALTEQARRLGLVRPGERLYIVKGVSAWLHGRLRSRAVDDDRAIVERQLGRPPRRSGPVAVRCPFGRPAVTEQAAFDESGEPFPTTYYVTCRHLVGGHRPARGRGRGRALEQTRAGGSGVA